MAPKLKDCPDFIGCWPLKILCVYVGKNYMFNTKKKADWMVIWSFLEYIFFSFLQLIYLYQIYEEELQRLKKQKQTKSLQVKDWS